MKAIEWIALIIVVIGAINWGLVGLFSFDLVSWLFVQNLGMAWLATTTYVVVGVCGLIVLFTRFLNVK